MDSAPPLVLDLGYDINYPIIPVLGNLHGMYLSSMLLKDCKTYKRDKSSL